MAAMSLVISHECLARKEKPARYTTIAPVPNGGVTETVQVLVPFHECYPRRLVQVLNTVAGLRCRMHPAGA